jgi:hypothetical protein
MTAKRNVEISKYSKLPAENEGIIWSSSHTVMNILA